MCLHVVCMANTIANIVLITTRPAMFTLYLTLQRKFKEVMFSFAFWRKVTIESKYFGGLFLKVSYFQSSRQCLSNSHVTLNHLGGLVKSADSGLAGLSPAHPWPRPPAAPTALRTADLQARVAQDTGMWSQIYLTSSASVLESQMNALHISSSLMFLIVLFSILMGFFFF